MGIPATVRILDAMRATEDELSTTESQLGTQLPAKYKQVMTTYGGGMFGFVDLLPVRAPNGGADDLVKANTGSYVIADFVAVAPVGSGDMWGFATSGGVCAEVVSIWDHETGEIRFDSDDLFAFLASGVCRGDRD